MAKSNRQIQYKLNKSAKVGKFIKCPVCGEQFKKTQYSQAFCCSACKDKYWNDKGDRHSEGYYEEHDAKSTERSRRRFIYGQSRVVCVGGELTPRQIEEVENFRTSLGHLYDIENGMLY